MAAKGHNSELRAAAKAIYLAQRGQIQAPQIIVAMIAQGLPAVTPPTVNNWKREGRWHDALGATEAPTPLSRASRGREIQDLVLDRGGEIALLEGVYGEMILAAAVVTDKLLAWANGVDPRSIKTDDALTMLKHVPPLVDRAMKLKETLADVRWRGAGAVLTDGKSDPAALNGEIMAPEGQKGQPNRTDKTERTAEPEPVSVQPALSDALSALAKARKAAPNLVKDVAPKARASIR